MLSWGLESQIIVVNDVLTLIQLDVDYINKHLRMPLWHTYYMKRFADVYIISAGLGSSAECMLDWWSGGLEFVALVLPHSFIEIDHEIFSTVILSLPLIQEGKLSVTCERMCTEYWLTA